MNQLNIFTQIVLFLFVLQVHAQGGDSKLNSSTNIGQTIVYVSPSGNDRSDGTITRPLQSLSKAQAKVRILKKKGHQDITVVLRGGTYPIKNTLFFGPEDSGKEGHPIIWKAYEGEKPVLSGGTEAGNWQNGENGIWQTKLDQTERLRQLYVNDRPATLAQYKKKVKGQGGYGKFVVKGDELWAYEAGEEIDGVLVRKDEMPVVAHPEELEILSQGTWTSSRLCIRGMENKGDNLALLFAQPFGAIALAMGSGTALKTNDNFSLYNAKEFITEPGEFCFDRSAKILYYKPQEGEDMLSAKVVVPQTESFIQIKGKDLKTHVSNLQFEGLTFAYSSWQLMRVENSYGVCGSQTNCLSVKYGKKNWHDDLYQTTALPVAVVEVNSADHIVFERNIFKLNGSMGVNFENDVVSSRVEGNVFQYIGGVAINVGNAQHVYIGKQNGENEGFGPYNIDNSHDKWTEKEEGLCTNILVSNNLIRNTGIEHKPSVVIMAYWGDGINITHNDIKFAPYSGISLGWGWEEWNGRIERSKGKPSLSLRNNSVTGNKIGYVLQTLHDGGGIYLLGRQSAFVKDPSLQQWTPICNNYLYDFGGVTRAGVHTDNGAEYYLCCNNVFNHLPWSLIKASEWGQKGHIRIEGNFANTALYFTEGNNMYAPYTVIKDNVDVENDEWPEAAKKIMDESGLEPRFRYLFQEIKSNQ
ncbi:MAG: hypothetical protein K0M50_10120 [Prolixibacteraceae bacterium]|nr:hypothetical protein [Prolixibacteraceae bacterium]